MVILGRTVKNKHTLIHYFMFFHYAIKKIHFPMTAPLSPSLAGAVICPTSTACLPTNCLFGNACKSKDGHLRAKLT
jgi:hypothetical protein